MAVTNFVWDELSDNVLMETDENDVVVANYTNEPSQFGEVVSQHRGDRDFYFSYDGLGSTRNLTRQNQTVSDSYTYSAFGETVASSGNTTNPFQFNGAVGYYTNTETGDFCVRRRTYDPGMARWHSSDPLGFKDGPNVYQYVRNQPIGITDPSGEAIKIEATRQLLSPQCGDETTGLACIRWRITLEGNWPCQRGEAGYLVQKVDFYCKINACATCPEEVPDEPAFSFLEAKVVSRNKPYLDDVSAATCLEKTDEDPPRRTCGIVKHVGEWQFVCIPSAQRLSMDDNWVGSGEHTFDDGKGCIITGGPYILDLTGGAHDLPDWWKESPSDDEHADRWFSLKWNCCDACDMSCNADADPKLDQDTSDCS